MSKPSRHVIRASEIGQFAYCPRAWYLGSVLGLPSANVADLVAGTETHRRHGRRVYLALVLQRVGIVLAALGTLALVLWAIARLGGG
ncbi:MAG: hypothetical protein QHH80_10340 [Anaerolineae bacterium]|nr:hypothetical protein [Anaerolineae bacterium]